MRRKLDRLTGELAAILRGRGADEETAALAARLAVACFLAAHHAAGEEATALLPALRRTFTRLDTIGAR
jgi:hypothetical protein